MTLHGKVAIITGAARGIGRDMALTFAKEGASVAIADVNEESLNRVARETQEIGTHVIASKVDISQKVEVRAFVDKVLKKLGTVDILVNNAVYASVQNFLEFDEYEWDKIMAVGLKGYFLCSQAVAKEMVKNRRGKIISLASMGGIIAMPTGCAYTASKAGVIGLTKAMALELGPFGINVNAIAPGPTATELLLSWISEEEKQARVSRIPLGRMGATEDIARTAVFLASDDSNFITGQVISVDGGFTAIGLPIKR